MGILRLLVTSIVFTVLMWSGTVSRAQDRPALVAPAYTGAYAYPCKAGDGDDATSCVFGTKDTVDKVKAFYDNAVGGLHAKDNGYVAALRAGRQTTGEGTSATVFGILSIETRPAVTLPPASDPKAQQATGKLKYLRVAAGLTAWPINGTRPWSQQEMNAAGYRPPEEFYKVFRQYGHLESAFFRDDQLDEIQQRYDEKIASINTKFHVAGEQAGQRMKGNFDQMQRDNAQRRQDLEKKRAEDCKRGPTAQQKADHEELGRIIKKNSAERYKRFAAATATMQKEGCGSMTPGSPAMQAGMEIGQILSEDPEAMAYAQKMQDRDGSNQQKNPAGDAIVKDIRGQQAAGPARGNEMWQAGLEYLASLDKIAYRTRISISGAKFGADKGTPIITDRAKVEDLWAKRKQSVDEDNDDASAGTSQPGAKPASQNQTARKSAPAATPEKTEDSSTSDTLKQGADAGIKLFKKLF